MMIVEFLPDLISGLVLSNIPVQSDEHVTNIMFPNSAGKKPDIFLTHRTNIQQSALRLLIKMFHKKLQGVAGVTLQSNVLVQILLIQICSGSSQ
jgi:hypothetical protein